jgi:Tol biopolymer transport system component
MRMHLKAKSLGSCNKPFFRQNLTLVVNFDLNGKKRIMITNTKLVIMFILSFSLVISGCDQKQKIGPANTPTTSTNYLSTSTTIPTITPDPTITAKTTIVPSPTAAFTPTPIGGSVRRLAFEIDGNNVSGKVATFLINSNGSNLIKIPSGGEAWFTSWFPNGKKIIYQQGYKSYIINMDDLNVEQIKQDFRIPEKFVNDFQVSPDGLKIAFVAMDGDQTNPRSIYVAHFDGVTITNPRFIWRGMDPVWSPDGSKLAFTYKDNPSYSLSNGSIHVIDPDGSHQVILTLPSEGLGDNRRPSWSPDGSRIAFYSGFPDAHKNDLFIMNSNGSNVVKLTESSSDDSSWPDNPSWSPDGHKIAFLEYSKENGNITSSIYMIDVDGTNKTLIFDCSPNICQYLSWAP